MKRRLVKLCVFLLLGAAVNVAVAWGCALRGLTEPAWRYSTRAPRAASPVDVSWLMSRGWTPYQSRDECLEWEYYVDEVETFGWRGTRYIAMEDLRCRGSWLSTPNPFAMSYRCGWPASAFCDEFVDQVVGGRYQPRFDPNRSRFGWNLPWASYVPQGRVATKPIWTGLIANSLMYSLLCFVLWQSPRVFGIRRLLRVRRGLCGSCAYPIGASPICTECGKPVKPKPAEAAA